MNISRINGYVRTGLRLSVVIVAAVWISGVKGQENRVQQLPAPPPLKIISKEELSQLSEARDNKTRIRITIDLAQGHLTKAEEFAAQQQFADETAEVGRYAALI